MVTTRRSRHRVAHMKEPEIQKGIPEFRYRDAAQTESLEGQKGSGSGHESMCNPAIKLVEMSHGD
jgi:hypothetical protein